MFVTVVTSAADSPCSRRGLPFKWGPLSRYGPQKTHNLFKHLRLDISWNPAINLQVKKKCVQSALEQDVACLNDKSVSSPNFNIYTQNTLSAVHAHAHTHTYTQHTRTNVQPLWQKGWGVYKNTCGKKSGRGWKSSPSSRTTTVTV